MTLSKTSDPNSRVFRTQMSRIDWGDLKSSFSASFRRHSNDRGASAPTMASAAAAVASSYGDGISGAHLDDSSSNRYAPSRYDPGSMDRIVDALPYDDTQYDSDISEDTEKAGVGGTARRQRRTKALFATGGIILMASVAIGVLLTQNPRYTAKLPWFDNNNSAGRGAGANFQVAYEPPNQQRLLEIAQQVVSACSESKLKEDLSECRGLCQYRICCFEKGQYSCAEDGEKDCAAYAGCEALMEGFVGGRKAVKWG